MFNFQKLKHNISSWNDETLASVAPVLKSMEEIYEIEQITAFYPKNLMNDKETVFYLFFKDGFAEVQCSKDHTIHRTCRAGLTVKELQAGRTKYENQRLLLVYGNGEEIGLNSLKDSNRDWNPNYADVLMELYKEL